MKNLHPEHNEESSASPAVGPGPDLSLSLHPLANRSQWPWLPKVGSGLLAPHPYCRDCGMVKFIGSARALDVGGMENLLARFAGRLRELGYVPTEAQRRLISMKLRALQADDSFSLSRESQLRLIARVASPYLGIPPDVTESYLRSC